MSSTEQHADHQARPNPLLQGDSNLNYSVESCLPESTFCSGYGTYHTNKPSATNRKPYQSWSLCDLDLDNPPSLEKWQAQWVIPSVVCDEYARNHRHQKQYGKFGFAWFDIDEAGHTRKEIEHVLDDLECDYYIYTTKSSTADYPKWRGIIPYETLIDANEHILLQEIINDLFEESGITPDRVNQRPAQIAFLPNRGDYYDSYSLDVWGPISLSSPILKARLKAKKAAVAEREMDIAHKREVNRKKMQQRIDKGERDVINVFNKLYPLEDMLIECGYKKTGPNRFLSPNSESGIPGVTIEGDKWFSRHTSDIGIGMTDSNGSAFGDVCDLWFHYYNNGEQEIQALKNFIQQDSDFDFDMPAFEGIDSDESPLTHSDEQSKPELKNELEFPLISVQQLKDTLSSNEWLIKGILEKDSYGMIFGEPASGKSLLMLDMAFCVAAGIDWNGHKTSRGKVVYIAGEGFNGLKRRVSALENKYDQSVDDLFFSKQPASLIDQNNVRAVAAAIEKICPYPALIVIDTLHRNFGSGDENSSQDFGIFTSNIDSTLRKSGATVLVVHHTGHGDKSRGRGSSSIKAALDVEYSIIKNSNDQVSMKCTKAKDFDEPEEQKFEIQSVDLDLTNDEGEPIQSVVITAVSDILTSPVERLTPREKVIFNALKKALDMDGCPPEIKLSQKDAELIVADSLVNLSKWREQAYLDMEEQISVPPTAKRQAFNRAKKVILELGLADHFFDYWWVT